MLSPVALDLAGIQNVIRAFAMATERALEAGFDLVELHAAHGYLLHEFLSPLSNRRSDQYGGGFENRIRLVVEVVDAVRAVLPAEVPLLVRISATDWAAGGWDIDQSVALAKVLKQHKVDLIDVSSGGMAATAVMPVGPGYQTAFAERIRREAEIPTGAVGHDYRCSAGGTHSAHRTGGRGSTGARIAAGTILAAACSRASSET